MNFSHFWILKQTHFCLKDFLYNVFFLNLITTHSTKWKCWWLLMMLQYTAVHSESKTIFDVSPRKLMQLAVRLLVYCSRVALNVRNFKRKVKLSRGKRWGSKNKSWRWERVKNRAGWGHVHMHSQRRHSHLCSLETQTSDNQPTACKSKFMVEEDHIVFGSRHWRKWEWEIGVGQFAYNEPKTWLFCSECISFYLTSNYWVNVPHSHSLIEQLHCPSKQFTNGT